MRPIAICIFFLHVSVFANALSDAIDVEYNGIIHSESEHMLGRNNDTTMPNDTNSFSTLYNELFLDYDITENFYLSFAAKANVVLGEDTYVTPMYLRGKLTSDDINRAIISELSFNYDDGLFALNIGRQEIDYDWLLGSIDGAVAMVGDDESYSFRLFWLENYRTLQYNYYMQIENINDSKGMFGAIAKANMGEVELSYFDYYIEDLRNIMGAHVNYIQDYFGLNLSYTSAKALALAAYDYDESFLNGSFELLVENSFMEFGFSQTGENGLLAMIQMGNFMFGQFYLNNQVDRENAQNLYAKYMYAKSAWRYEFIGGATRYDNSFVEIQKVMESYELDAYIHYTYNKYLSFDTGAMYMDVDERDPLQVDQAFVMFNVVLSYENY